MFKKLCLAVGLLAASFGLRAQNTDTYYFTDFNDLGVLTPKPTGWVTGFDNPSAIGTGNFNLATDKGIDGTASLYANNVSNTNMPYFYTQALNMGTSPMVEFYYMATGVTGAASPNSVRILVSVSTDDASTCTLVDSLSAAEVTDPGNFTLKHINLPETYANQSCRLKFNIFTVNNGASNVYFDNFAMGTKAEQKTKDLAVVGTLGGSANPGLNTETSYTVKVSNNGSETQSLYSVRLMQKSEGSDKVLDTVKGEPLESAKNTTYTLHWTPTVGGDYQLYAEVLLDGDEDASNNKTEVLEVSVLSSGTALVLGNGTMKTAGQPFGFGDKQQICQELYLAEEMQYACGEIRSITYEGVFQKNLSAKVKIWMGETDSSNLSAWNGSNMVTTWIDPATLTLVYDGTLNFPEGDHQKIKIDLSTPCTISGSRNFVIYTYTENETPEEEWETGQFYATAMSFTEVTGAAVATNGENLVNASYMPVEDAANKFQRANAVLILEEKEREKYYLVFNINDQDGYEVENAVITLNDSTYPAGKYRFDSLFAGGYRYSVSKTGYATATGSLNLTKSTSLRVDLWDLQNTKGASDFLWEDFETIEAGHRPYAWEGDFIVEKTGGVDGSQRLSHSFWYLDGPRELTTQPVFMGSEPVFEFQYRVMDRTSYPNKAFAGSNLTWKVEVSRDMGKNWTLLYEEDYGKHVSSKDYETFNLDVSQYANEVCLFHIYVNRDNQQADEFYFDIDNMRIGTRHETDLNVLSPLKGRHVMGVEQENNFTVYVRNAGKKDVAAYTVKLRQDGETVLSLEGKELASGKTVAHNFTYTPTADGDYTLTAEVVAEGDEVAFNNLSANFYLNVQPTGISAFNIASNEGEDIIFNATPYNFYYPYSFTETLYDKSDLKEAENKAIGGIAYRSCMTRELSKKKITVWVGETDSTFITAARREIQPHPRFS